MECNNDYRVAKPVMTHDGMYVWMPLIGDGEFGPQAKARVRIHTGRIFVSSGGTLSYEERCRLCDAHRTHMFFWKLCTIPASQGYSGAFLRCIPYQSGVIGKAPAYPAQTATNGYGGARV